MQTLNIGSINIFFFFFLILLFSNCEHNETCPQGDPAVYYDNWLPGIHKGDSVMYADSLGNTINFFVTDEELSTAYSHKYDNVFKKKGCSWSAKIYLDAFDANGFYTYGIVYSADQISNQPSLIYYIVNNHTFEHPLYDIGAGEVFPESVHYDTIRLLDKSFSNVYRFSLPQDSTGFAPTVYVQQKAGILAFMDKDVLFLQQ